MDDDKNSVVLDLLRSGDFKSKRQLDKFIWDSALRCLDMVILSRIEKGQDISDEKPYYQVYYSTYRKMKSDADEAWEIYTTGKSPNTSKPETKKSNILNGIIDKIIKLLSRLKK